MNLGLLLGSLRSLCAILGAGLHSSVHALSIKSAANDVITHTGEVFNTTAAHHYYRVLLKIVTDAGNIGGHFHTVR